MKFSILGYDAKIEIEVFTQSYPESIDYWDGNWLKANLVGEIPGFNANFDLQLRTDELKDFTDQLKELTQNPNAKAALYNLDGYVEIVGETTPFGDIEWAATLCYPAGNGATLRFNFHSDPSSLHQLINELDDIVSIFPVVGTP